MATPHEQRMQDDENFLKDSLKKTQPEVVTKLSTYIDGVWAQNKEDNKHTRNEMVKQLRRARGEYDPLKLQNIRAFKGSEVYLRTAENKCRSAYSWITDIYRGDNDLPWSLEPTALPTLPDETKAQLEAEINRQGMFIQQQMIQEAHQTGKPYDPNAVSAMMNDWHEAAEKKAMDALNKDAKRKCDSAALLIRDQNQEGGWNAAFKNFLWYFIRVKAGIIKGPTLTKKPKQEWRPDGIGGFSLQTTDQLANDVYCVSPFNFFPAKDMCTVNDGDIIEIHELSQRAVSDLIGVPGYSKEELNMVLAEIHSGKLNGHWLTLDDETVIRQVEKEKNLMTIPNTAVTLDNKKSKKIQAQEFWGSVSGRMLMDWGLKGEVDPNQQYQANCWKIGTHVIKAVINPDNLGRKPYHVSSWAKSPSWIWGEGLLEFAEPIEDILNSITRALQNNIAIASGPQVEINIDRCDDKTPVYPWKRWESTSAQLKEGPAIQFWQPQMHTQELTQTWEFFSKVLDEMTVPAYAQGASQSGVTAGTATVFTQLLAAASRSIKAVVANIDDDIITPYIQMCYDYNMKFGKDIDTKGDANVVAKGVSGLLAKEQQAQRKVEFLQVIANPTFTQILGGKNIGAILGQIAKANDISLPDMDRLDGDTSIESIIQQMTMAQAGVDANQATGQIGAGGDGVKAQVLNPDGSKAGVMNG